MNERRHDFAGYSAGIVYLAIAFCIVAVYRKECAALSRDMASWLALRVPRQTRLTGKLAADVKDALDNAG